MEASSCQRVIHKKVGDSVELSSCLPTEGVTVAIWRYGQLTIADKDEDVSEKYQFKGRVYLNHTNFDLTVRRLTLQDSGDFSFVSEVNNKQRKTVMIKLQVHGRTVFLCFLFLSNLASQYCKVNVYLLINFYLLI